MSTTAEPAAGADADVGICDPRVARSRAAVLAATVDLLGELGHAGTTVEAIAERSGVAKTTIYRHWPSRAPLLIDAFHSSGATIVLVSHDLQSVQDLCSRTAWIEGGAVRAIGPTRDVIAQYESTVHHR